MTTRDGMTDLLQQLRAAADVGTADYTAGTVSYWSDEQLQAVMDRHRINIYQEELTQYPTIEAGGVYSWNEYRASMGNLESGTAVFLLQQLNGGTAPDYEADYNTGVITFDENTWGTAYMLTARSYDVNAAAAEVWRNKAANAAKYFDFQTDNHRFSKSQLRKQFLEQAQFYDAQSYTQSFNVTTVNRSDVNAGGDYDG